MMTTQVKAEAFIEQLLYMIDANVGLMKDAEQNEASLQFRNLFSRCSLQEMQQSTRSKFDKNQSKKAL